MNRAERRRGPSAGGLRARRRTSSALALGGAVTFLLALVVLTPLSGLAGARVLADYRGTVSASGHAPTAPFASVGQTAGAGACLSTEATSLPFGAGSPRSSVQVTVPHGCPTRTRLVFLPSTQFTNGLSTPAGHVFDARLDIVSVAGTTAMVRSLHLYLQQVGAGNPILTATRATVTNGAVTTASTSVANVSALNTYGIGMNVRLNLQATTSTATLVLLLVVFVNDRGVVRSLDMQYVALALTY